METLENNTNSKDTFIRIRIDAESKNRFYSKCEKEGRTPSKVIRILIDKFCNDLEQKS